MAAGETGTVIVQGRGQVAGPGTLVGTLNNSRSVQESSYDNNVKQLNVTIDSGTLDNSLPFTNSHGRTSPVGTSWDPRQARA